MNKQYSVLEKFVVDHQESIYRLAYSYVHNRDDALDIVQEAICKAMNTKAGLRDPSGFKSWFYRIVVNTALDLLRKRKRVQPIEDEQLFAFMDGTEDTYTNIDLEQTLQHLPEMYRTVIVLRFFEDLTLEEVADVLHENLNTVKARLYRGLGLLKIQMDDTTPERGSEHGSTSRTAKSSI